MLVRAIREGFYGNQRRMPGDVFDMSVKLMSKDKAGKASLPKWVEDANRKSEPVREEPRDPAASKEQQVI